MMKLMSRMREQMCAISVSIRGANTFDAPEVKEDDKLKASSKSSLQPPWGYGIGNIQMDPPLEVLWEDSRIAKDIVGQDHLQQGSKSRTTPALPYDPAAP
jgi:hypothetical protein